MAITAPLDLQYWLVNTLSGSYMIFFAIAMIFIIIMSAKFRMSFLAIGGIVALFVGIFSAQYMWALVLVGISVAVYGGYQIIKLITK